MIYELIIAPFTCRLIVAGSAFGRTRKYGASRNGLTLSFPRKPPHRRHVDSPKPISHQVFLNNSLCFHEFPICFPLFFQYSRREQVIASLLQICYSICRLNLRQERILDMATRLAAKESGSLLRGVNAAVRRGGGRRVCMQCMRESQTRRLHSTHASVSSVSGARGGNLAQASRRHAVGLP